MPRGLHPCKSLQSVRNGPNNTLWSKQVFVFISKTQKQISNATPGDYRSICIFLEQAVCNMPLPPPSLTVISCKYENRQRLQFTTEFAKRQTTTTRKQSNAHQNMGTGYAFLPIKQVDLTMAVVNL